MSFEKDKSAFLDENARLIPDPEHSDGEDRFMLLGLNIQLRLLPVCRRYREEGNVIRIISARKIQQIHLPSGRHQRLDIPFPDWVPEPVLISADKLISRDAADWHRLLHRPDTGDEGNHAKSGSFFYTSFLALIRFIGR